MAELDAERIASTALAIVDERGVEGFTMRAVAEALGVTPMALYHHVKDKAALAALVVDAAASAYPLPSPTGRWEEDLWEMARWMRASRAAHPLVGQLRREYRIWTPAILRMSERWLALWQQSGLPLDDAVLAATTSSMAIVGLVEEEAIFRKLELPDEKLLSWLPNARLVFSAPHDRDADFELLVRSLVAGMHMRLTRARKPLRRGSAKPKGRSTRK